MGAEGTSFRFIVASGERGAMPHGVASAKELAAGELVTMDFGAVFQAYATDMTRTVCLGQPDSKQEAIYEIVREAQQQAAKALKPGMTAKEADGVAREIISRAGYGDQFGHGLGHGVGMETHELPVLSFRSEAVLEPGMVVTVEPGIYLPGWGGVRIEDMMLITETGAETMTHSARELLIIQPRG
jgi:Xaa-Pro aminopeptidase